MRKTIYSLLLTLTISAAATAQRTETTLTDGWKFHRGDAKGAQSAQFDDRKWQQVSIPHDWAIFGPFDRNNDLQVVQVMQDMEKKASLKTGRTGGLPYMGIGWYRNTFSVAAGKRAWLVFEGAMNEPTIFVNGQKAAFYPNGYSSRAVEITPYLTQDGSANTVAVRLENRAHSSRWYPGAGLFRPVRLVTTGGTYIPRWSQVITTPHVSRDNATVAITTPIEGFTGDSITISHELRADNGQVVGTFSHRYSLRTGNTLKTFVKVQNPQLWSPESPSLYRLSTTLSDSDGTVLDSISSTMGIRTIAYVPEEGFFLNGKHRKIQGVCVHHDLGALGSAINPAAISYRLKLLKDMGCDAIRTSHNIPSPELARQCDSLGFMLLVEPFDEWDIAKCDSGYHPYFNEWAENDVAQMVRVFRNHPSVVLWGIGNEIPNQLDNEGWRTVKRLQDVCHREDPTRPVTVCMDQVATVLTNDFARDIDIPGINYRTHKYYDAKATWTQGMILGSETASTVSSRGVYKFPVKMKLGATYDDHQSSGYDVEACPWSNVPDIDFELAERNKWYLGQFVWTGYDYLGEPTPYNNDAWPSHSSLFGIIDLANIPKDRYYLYRSQWNRNDRTLHVLPSWNHEGMEGKNVPVFAYTDAPEAELFVNGKSYGRAHKYSFDEVSRAKEAGDELALLRRYRLIWDNVTYEPGEIEVVAYYNGGKETLSQKVKTAGKPYALRLEADKNTLKPGCNDLAFVTITVVDRDGNPCPNADNMVRISVKGAGKFRAAANGNAADVHEFHTVLMPAFSGKLQAIIESGNTSGTTTIEATAKGLKKGILALK